jgi:hypothetical protein
MMRNINIDLKESSSQISCIQKLPIGSFAFLGKITYFILTLILRRQKAIRYQDPDGEEIQK